MVYLILLSCMIDPSWAQARFERTFRAATSKPTVILAAELDHRAETRWSKDKQTFVVRYNPGGLCPSQNEAQSIGEWVDHIAAHEACHVVLHGERLKDDTPITQQQRMRMELQAEACAVRWLAE